MRNAFADEITRLAGDNDKLVLLSGDIGNRLFNKYKESYGERFYNCGVAESNMAGVAAGLALSGMRPITYTITPFNIYRCFEQIRIDICYHKAPVIIVGVGAGLSYAQLGATHHSCEDIAVMRTLPNMTILCPGDAMEVRSALRCALAHNGPVYLRIGKKNEPVVHSHPPEIQIGKGLIVQEGKDICLLSTGNTLPLAMDSAKELERKGHDVQVVSMHTVKPLDKALLQEIFSHFSLIATIEEHNIHGGLATAVTEWLQHNRQIKSHLCKFGIPDRFLHSCGNQQSARASVGLTPEKIADDIHKKME